MSYLSFLKAEDWLHIGVGQYLTSLNLLWFHSPNEGKRSRFEQWYVKQLGLKKGIPDIIIIEPNQKYSGLAIELKADGVVVYNKDSTVRKAMKTQYDMLLNFRSKGFYADFSIGFDEAKTLIDNYLNNKL